MKTKEIIARAKKVMLKSELLLKDSIDDRELKVELKDNWLKLIHLPTGIEVKCERGNSWHESKEKAIKLLEELISKQGV